MSDSNTNIEEKKTSPFKHQTKKQLMMEIFRFLLVGGLATLCDYIAFYTLRYFIGNSNLAVFAETALGFTVGLIINYFLSVIFVYREVSDSSKTKSMRSFVLFAVIGLIGLAITEVGMLLQNIFIPGHDVTIFNITFDIVVLAFKCLMTGIVLVWNYIGRKLFIFK